MKSSSRFCEDAQDKDGWRVRIKEAIGYSRFTWKMTIKLVCVL